MPTYEYRCEACLQEIEEFQSINAPPLVECRACGAKKLKRKIGGGQALLRFSGKGFYVTDYTASQEGSQDPSTKPRGSCPCGDGGGCST